MKGHKKKLIPVVLLLIIVCLLVYFNFIKEDVYIGQVEAQIVTHPAEVSGKIMVADISLGQNVKAGDTIAVIDSKDQEYALTQLELSLEKAKLASADAQKSGNSKTQSAVAAAQASANAAAATASKAASDYTRAQELFAGGAISQEALDAAKLHSQTAQSALSAAQAQVALAKGGNVSESLDVDVALLESKIAQQKDLIERCTIKASEDGTIMSKNYGKGDLVAAGYNIADIASSSKKYLVIYYPKEHLADLSYDQNVLIGYNGEEIPGVIKFIDVKPQYTPQDLQTSANKNKESMKVKILLPEDCLIKPGEQARVLTFSE